MLDISPDVKPVEFDRFINKKSPDNRATIFITSNILNPHSKTLYIYINTLLIGKEVFENRKLEAYSIINIKNKNKIVSNK